MSDRGTAHTDADRAPGQTRDEAVRGIRGYLIGMALAASLTALSFWVALDRSIFWQPGVAIGLLVLAVAQMGIHLVLFLHLSSGPDNANNSLAVAFGVLVITLFGAGTLWIMANLNTKMAPMTSISAVTSVLIASAQATSSRNMP